MHFLLPKKSNHLYWRHKTSYGEQGVIKVFNSILLLCYCCPLNIIDVAVSCDVSWETKSLTCNDVTHCVSYWPRPGDSQVSLVSDLQPVVTDLTLPTVHPKLILKLQHHLLPWCRLKQSKSSPCKYDIETSQMEIIEMHISLNSRSHKTRG